MARNEEDYLWLINSPAMKILQEGMEFRDIFVPLMDLHDKYPILSEKLREICARLEFVEQLKYSTMFFTNEYDKYHIQYQLDRLCTYLTLTCVDVAARGGDEKNSRGKTGIRFKGYLSTELPDWIKGWLSSVYILKKGKEMPYLSSPPDWFSLAPDERCKRISSYLYNVRNEYTHTVVYRQPLEREKSGTWVVTINGEKYGFTKFNEKDDYDSQAECWVGIKQGLIESDVVRLILVAQLRKWLGIIDENDLIETSLKRSLYRRLGFRFIKELNFNLDQIQHWCVAYIDWIKDFTFHQLYDADAQAFCDLHKEMYPHREALLGNIKAYLRKIKTVNQKLNEFSQAGNASSTSYMENFERKGSLLREIVGDNEMQWLMSVILDIRRDLFQRLDMPYY